MGISSVEDLRNLLSKAFPNTDLPDDLTNLGYGSFAEWDSLGNFALLLLIEEHFGIKFTMNELSEIKTIEEIMERLRENKANF